MSTMPPVWLTYPDSRAQVNFRPERAGGEIDVLCNPQGLGSLVGVLLWLTSFSDHGSLSVSALPFIHVEGPLALSIVVTNERQAFQGQIVRLDKDRQLEWRVYDDQLKDVALTLIRVATSPDYVNYFSVNVSPDSDAGLRFEVMDASKTAVGADRPSASLLKIRNRGGR